MNATAIPEEHMRTILKECERGARICIANHKHWARAYNIDVDELVNVAFINVIGRYGRWSPKLGKLKTYARYAVNGAFGDFYRKFYPRIRDENGNKLQLAFLHTDDVFEFFVNDSRYINFTPEFEAKVMKDDWRCKLRQKFIEIFKRLPKRYRLMMYLYYIEGKLDKEIGIILGVTEGRVAQMRKYSISCIKGAVLENCKDFIHTRTTNDRHSSTNTRSIEVRV